MAPRPRWVIWYAVALHTAWAVLLLFGSAPLGSTAMHVFAGVPRPLVVAALVAVVIPAAWAANRRRVPSRWTLLAVLPQQAVLTMSAVAAVSAVVQARYGDGVIRPRGFIAADQAPVVLTMVLHTFAIIEMHVAKRLPHGAPCGGCWWPAPDKTDPSDI